ncbi:hypothetical protein [Streptomyces sp. NPDC045714]|uniref:hypothetical protein n=1 Tax=Streptomyces sp. NPDC045714 TaxID=3154913 RepID=UPI0033D09331
MRISRAVMAGAGVRAVAWVRLRLRVAPGHHGREGEGHPAGTEQREQLAALGIEWATATR